MLKGVWGSSFSLFLHGTVCLSGYCVSQELPVSLPAPPPSPPLPPPGDGGYARDARLKAPSSLAVAPNGTLYIADLGNIRIRAVSPNQPQPNSAGLVEISSPLDQELYLFNQVRPSGGRFSRSVLH